MALPPPAPDSTCLVSGASSGIGADLARSLAARGHGVTLVARRSERLEALAAELRRKSPVRVETIGCDLGDAGARDRLVSELADRDLAVEVLVNNAGFGSAGLFTALDRDRELEMVRVNIEAVVDLCGRFVGEMVQRGRGAVLNVASTAGFQPLPRQATYSASKAFVVSFTDSLHAELKHSGVTATALCPGPVRTEFARAADWGGSADGLPGFLWADSASVAEEAVEGLETGRRVVVPGRLNQAGALGGRHAPRGLLLQMIGQIWPVGR